MEDNTPNANASEMPNVPVEPNASEETAETNVPVAPESPESPEVAEGVQHRTGAGETEAQSDGLKAGDRVVIKELECEGTVAVQPLLVGYVDKKGRPQQKWVSPEGLSPVQDTEVED